MKRQTTKNILLFTNGQKPYFHTELESFRKIVECLKQISPIRIKTIDVCTRPRLAEKYKIEALPTLLIHNWRFVGEPCQERIIKLLEEIK